MKVISTIISGLLTVILIGVAGVFLASLVPLPGSIEIKIVKSGSMEPAITTGSLVIIKPDVTTYGAKYNVGEVITFGPDTAREIPTTHRVTAIAREGNEFVYTTKGDANEEQDPNPVPASDVIGEVVFALPYAGYILDFAKKPLGFALLIGIPAAAIMLDEASVIVKEFVKMRRRKDRYDGDAMPGQYIA
jgi:signal peptidase I